MSDSWGKNAILFESVDELLIEAQKREGCILVIDESALTIDRYDASQLWLAKAARHNHHSSFFIGQNFVDIPKGMRTNCTQFFIFASSRTDAKKLADEFDDDSLLNISKLEPGEFFHIHNRKIKRGRIEFATQKIYMEN